MASVQLTNVNGTILCKKGTISLQGFSSALPLSIPRVRAIEERAISQSLSTKETTLLFSRKRSYNMTSKKVNLTIPRCSSPPNSTGSRDEPSDQTKTPFGYTRKDVLLIGLGVTIAGIGLKSGLEFFGVDPLQAGNAVQLIFVLGLTIGWISTYIFRVANKDMTYAQQLRDYESKVMEKRLEGLTEAELEALLEQVEEEKRRLASGEQVN
ncbi:uncharacterized protein LOC130761934 isoform X1 [Actinidia eriantha]|uniref:uncharacterized protein LOC130761934 isoform X1 n=1 Tax=Actinidia eriantha TaxID=165200 RepID=UPI00258CB8C6|nr:uncharacterized protein LOC130761934 isoform X1 [Actinidia eriantha]